MLLLLFVRDCATQFVKIYTRRCKRCWNPCCVQKKFESWEKVILLV